MKCVAKLLSSRTFARSRYGVNVDWRTPCDPAITAPSENIFSAHFPTFSSFQRWTLAPRTISSALRSRRMNTGSLRSPPVRLMSSRLRACSLALRSTSPHPCWRSPASRSTSPHQCWRSPVSRLMSPRLRTRSLAIGLMRLRSLALPLPHPLLRRAAPVARRSLRRRMTTERRSHATKMVGALRSGGV